MAGYHKIDWNGMQALAGWEEREVTWDNVWIKKQGRAEEVDEGQQQI
jgi:hypothetical protein